MATAALKMSDRIYAELTSTCDALGYNDGNKIHLDKNSIEVIKDLIRYLRRDDDTHSVRRYLGQSKLLQRDLIKIFVEHSDKSELWNVLLRLLINLTSPALMVYNEELPSEKITRSYYLQILSHLQEYKSEMTNEAVWGVVHKKLQTILSIESTERGEENEIILERILNLIRNVLRVPASDHEHRTDNDTTVHDQLLFALHTSGISDLLVYIASTSKEQQYHMQILEIIAFMLQGQNPAKLAKVEMQRSNEEKQDDVARLMLLRQKEIGEKMTKMKKYAGSRHSRFGGTYVVQNMKAIGDNEMLCHKPYQKIEDLDFSITKQKTKKRKNKNGITNVGEERVSALSVRLFLKEFCVEFLNGAYNPVMRHARSCINGNTGAGATVDASHYLWALRFFMNFNRHYKFRVKYVSETISTEVFYLVQRQIEHNYEMINSDKKKVAFWSTRLHLGINAYQELLYTLIEMDKCADKGVKNSSRVIMGNIFYVPEYRDTILSQLLNYNELTMSRDYLVDLVTTTHIFLKMLKNFCEKERHIVVQKVKRKKPKKKAKPATSGPTAAVGPPPSLEDRWVDVGPEVSAVLQQNAIPTVVPFDATIDTPIDEQKGDAMKRIQKLLRSKNYEEAIGLLRSARDVWPENESFGKVNIPVEEEFLVLREIFFAELGVPEETPVDPSQNQKSDENHIESLLNYEDEEDDEEDEENEQPQFEESNFKFMDFLQRFANVRVVSNLNILLQQFDKNKPELNHYVLKILHQIAIDCKMPAMMYQASIFRVFQRVFQSENRSHKELAGFARFIFRGFVAVAMKNPKAYMELLFWKSTKQAVEMTDGYDTEHSTNKKASRNTWTEEEEEELRTLFMEHQTNKYPQDLIDYLLEHLINQDRTRRGVIKKLKEMYLIVNSKAVRNEIQKRLPKEWSEEEIAQLTELWEQVKEDDDPVGLIYDGLRIKRSKPKIKEKLLELKLAEDPKQLRKKRKKKSEGPKASWETRSASEDEGSDSESDADNNDDDDNDDNDNEQARSSKKKEKKQKKEKPQAKKKSKQPTIVYTDAQLSGLLKDVIEKNMQDALKWLKESLEDSLEDRDEESNEGQALVPLTAETSQAMDTPSFQRFLCGAGIQPPDLEEAYWRIPATMLVSTIKKRCELIDAALRGEFVEEVIEKKNNDSESEDEDLFEKLKSYSKVNNSEQASSVSGKSTTSKSSANIPNRNSDELESNADNHDAENEDSSHDTNSSKNQKHKNAIDSEEENVNSTKLSTKSQNDESKSKSKRIRAVFDSSDSEEDQEKILSEDDSNKIEITNDDMSKDKTDKSKPVIESDSEDEKMNTQSQKETDLLNKSNSKEGSAKSSRIRKVLDSDSEEETEKVLQSADELLENKRIRSENSDTETPAQKKRRIVDSDEEDTTPVSKKSVETKQARILSDDED